MGDVAQPEDDGAVMDEADPVPRMPAFRVHNEYGQMPVPLVRGLSPTIGWRWLPEQKGGPAFVVISQTRLGLPKAHDQFPLTEEGWARAWRSLEGLSPGSAAKAAHLIQALPAPVQGPGSGTALELDAGAVASLHGVTFLGGYGMDAAMRARERYDARFIADRLVIRRYRRPEVVEELLYGDIEDVEIGGPGVVRSGGGFRGGGFGAAGAIEGMAIAAALNALTVRTKITTVIRVQASTSELFLLDTKLPPDQLRIHLSQPLAAIRAARAASEPPPAASPVSPVAELTKLASMLEGGLLTREEFDTLKARILNL